MVAHLHEGLLKVLTDKQYDAVFTNFLNVFQRDQMEGAVGQLTAIVKPADYVVAGDFYFFEWELHAASDPGIILVFCGISFLTCSPGMRFMIIRNI